MSLLFILLLAQPLPEPRALRPDTVIADSVGAGGSARWSLRLNGGERATISVCQISVDLAVTLTGNDGTPPVEQDDSEEGRCEELSWTADRSSQWNLVLRPYESGAAGQYTIKSTIGRATDTDREAWLAVVADARVRVAATSGDRQALDALIADSLTRNERRFAHDASAWGQYLHGIAAFLDARSLTNLATPIMTRAVEVLESHADTDKTELAGARHSLGAMQEKLGRWSDSRHSFARAVELWRALGTESQRELAVDLNRLAKILADLGLYDEAAQNFALSLQTFRGLPNVKPLELARATNNLGHHLFRLARFAEAEALFREALAQKEAVLGPRDEQLSTEIGNLAEVYRRLGRLDDADRLYRRLIDLLADVPEKSRLITAMGNLALLRADQGRVALALQGFDDALAMASDERAGRLAKAWLRNNRAELLFGLGRYVDADVDARAALEIQRRELPAVHVDIADSLSILGKVARAGGAFDKAIAAYEEATRIRRTVLGRSHPDVGLSLNDLATAHMELAHLDVANRLLLEAIEIYRATLPPDGHPWLTAAIMNRGLVLKELGRSSEAETLLLASLKQREAAIGESSLELGATLNALATLYEDQGRFREALLMEQRALAIVNTFLPPGHPQIAATLQNLGSIEESQGRLESAETLYRRSAQLLEGTPAAKHPNQASVLDHLAHLVLLRGGLDEAADLYRRAADIRAEALPPAHPDNALSAEHAAGIAFVRHQDEDAERWLRKALSIREAAYGPRHPTVSGTLTSLAVLLDQTGRALESSRYVEGALAILDETPVEPGRRATLYALKARQLQRKGDADSARAALQQAITVAEALRPNVGGSEETQAAFFTGYTEIYHRMVVLEVMGGRVDAALRHSEARRARVLADQLLSTRSEWRDGIPAHRRSALEARETVAKARLASAQRRVRAARADELPEAIAFFRAAEQEVTAVYEEMRNASPRWDVRTPVDLPALAPFVSRVAPDAAAVLAYDLGEDDSLVFWLTANGQKAYRLEIDEQSARALGTSPGALTAATVSKLLTGRDSPQGGIVESLASPRRGVRRVAAQNILLTDRLAALWNVLIPPDLRRELLAAQDVVVIPDGALTLLPFEALVVERRGNEATSYWIDQGPVVQYAPSLATLEAIVRRTAPNAVRRGETPFLSLSGVVYDAPSSRRSPRPDARLPVPPANGGWLPLAASVTESDAFVRAARPARVQLLQGRMATESAVRRATDGKRIVHLATHAVLPDPAAGLTGGIVLAVGADERSSTEDDGMLELHELYELPLSAAWLTVLSACETNVGRPVDGEGVFALSRAALVAGSYSVIASQWSVDDRSTARLFETFFTAALRRESTGDLTVSRALRDARRMVRQSRAWADPYYWAPFVFIGPVLRSSALRQ